MSRRNIDRESVERRCGLKLNFFGRRYPGAARFIARSPPEPAETIACFSR